MATVLNVKIDNKLKKEAQEVAKKIGLPISTVVTSSLREFVRTRSITISDTPRLKPEIEQELLSLSQEARKGKNISPAFTSLKQAQNWLEK